MFFADDAVTVEADLHRAFDDRRVNVINQRREFFFATPAEVRTVLLEQEGTSSSSPKSPKPPNISKARSTGLLTPP
jgi:hypothetical protein